MMTSAPRAAAASLELELRGRLEGHRGHADGRRYCARAEQQRHHGTAPARRGRQRHAHLARAAIADEPRGIDRLVRRPRGHDDALAREVLRRQHVRRSLDDVRRLGEAARPGPPAREDAVAGTDDLVARDVDEAHHVRLGQRVVPHVDVHRGCEQHRRARRQRDRGDRVVGLPRGQLGDRGRGRRRDHHEVGAIGELDVTDRRLLGQREEAREHRSPRQRLERHRADELLRARGHRDLDVRARLVEQADQLGGLVRRDAARDADDDPRTGERCRRIAWRPLAAWGVTHHATLTDNV